MMMGVDMGAALTPTEWALVAGALATVLTVVGSALAQRRGNGLEGGEGRVVIDPHQGSSVLIEGAVRGMVAALNDKDKELAIMRAERDDLARRLADCEAARHGAPTTPPTGGGPRA